MKCVVLGAGPAGLSIGRLLSEAGWSVTLLEKEDRVGGKCLSYTGAGGVIEFGTCYATQAHKLFGKWADEGGFARRDVGQQVAYERPVMEFIIGDNKLSFGLQLSRYFQRRAKILKGIEGRKQWAFDEAAMPLGQWLEYNRLPALERFFQRSVVACGYGYLDTVPTLHALRWNDLSMIVTGLKKFMWMPEAGWQAVWDYVSTKIDDLRLNNEAVRVTRHQNGGSVTDIHGNEHAFDILVNALPMDVFTSICANSTREEQSIEAAVSWSDYSCALVSADWFEDYPIWVNPELSQQGHGSITGGRAEQQRLPSWKGSLYIVGQNSDGFTDSELDELVMDGVSKAGGKPYGVVDRKRWRYFPQLSRSSIEGGILQTMTDIQGRNKTYHTGATFSHESVSHIMDFNEKRLMPQITKHHRVKRTDRAYGNTESIEAGA